MNTPKVKRAANAVPVLTRKEGNAAPPTVGQASRQRIGNELRSMYAELLNQPVPDRFAELLGRLELRGEEGKN